MQTENNNLDPNTLFITNINYQTTAEELAKAFEKYGKVVKSTIMKDRIYGQFFSRGKGFIEFADTKSVEEALADKELTVGGRKLEVKQAFKKYEPKNDTAFVSGIPQGTTRDDILNELKNYNAVDCAVVYEDANGYRGGFAFVKFASSENRNKAIDEKNKFQLKGEESYLKPARRDFDEVN